MCLCFRLGWAIGHDSWLRFQEAISKCIHARCSRIIYSFACSLGWRNKCLTECSHYSIPCILTGAHPLKSKVVFCCQWVSVLIASRLLNTQQTTGPLDFFHYVHYSCTMYLRSLFLSVTVSHLGLPLLLLSFFFFALNKCDAISSPCTSLTVYSIRGVGVYLVGMLASAEVA